MRGVRTHASNGFNNLERGDERGAGWGLGEMEEGGHMGDLEGAGRGEFRNVFYN